MYRKYIYKAFRERLKFNHGVFNVVEILMMIMKENIGFVVVVCNKQTKNIK